MSQRAVIYKPKLKVTRSSKVAWFDRLHRTSH